MTVWYNDNNAYVCRVLRARVLDGSLPMGDVDERDITEIEPEEVAHYSQWHLFAGIGGFPLGLKWAGFPAGVRILTGGFPCQDISNAGLRAGIGGARSGLWGEMARFIRVLRPELVIVENVAALLHRGMERVLGDLAACGYDAEWDCIPAAAVGAPHLRDRVFIVAYPQRHAIREQSNGQPWCSGSPIASSHGAEQSVAHADSGRFAEQIEQRNIAGCRENVSDATSEQHKSRCVENERPPTKKLSTDATRPRNGRLHAGQWREGQGTAITNGSGEDVADADGGRCEQRHARERDVSASDARSATLADAERHGRQQSPEIFRRREPFVAPIGEGWEWWAVEPDVGRVADGVPNRVGKLAGLGNAIVPQIAQFIATRIMQAFQIQPER